MSLINIPLRTFGRTFCRPEIAPWVCVCLCKEHKYRKTLTYIWVPRGIVTHDSGIQAVKYSRLTPLEPRSNCDRQLVISYPMKCNTGRVVMFSVITNIYNKKTKAPTLMEFFTVTGKLKKFFLTTRDILRLHHRWHGTHRYDIQVLATYASTSWSVCGKNLNIISMCAVSPVVQT